MKLSAKIIVAALGTVAAAVVIGLVVQRKVIRDQGVELTRNTMRAAVLEAENVRESISSLGEHGAFDRAKLVKEFEENHRSTNATLYATIPVVSAWNALSKVAQKEGYEFRVCKRQARNSKNLPTAAEEAILDALESGSNDEYFGVSRERDEIVYARPIRLTADCCACHGDPKTSPTGDGKDVVGGTMENWKAGEVHGAFILKSKLNRVNQVVHAGMLSTLVLVLPLSALIGVGFFWLNRVLIVRPLKNAIEELDSAGQQTAEAANEVSQVSQSIAQGAAEQTASMEKTSAALQEVLGTTTSNAEHAEEVRKTVSHTRAIAESGAAEMRRLCDAMDAIKSAGDNVAKIIKTIDGIAFQTNLLALNASVEAARAGEAGMGFAIVAEEVRALAQRSAKAAKETDQIINEAIAKSTQGIDFNAKAALSFEDIAFNIRNVDTVVSQIAAATQQQKNRIQQINDAVAQIEKVIQQGSASTQETAAATEELHAQAETLKGIVGSLHSLIAGTEIQSERPAVPLAANARRASPRPRPASPKKPKSSFDVSAREPAPATRSADAGMAEMF